MNAPAKLALLGFTAAAAQIVLLRELLSISGGNEITIGLSLACWLFWTAVGGTGLLACLGFKARQVRRPVPLFPQLP